MHRVQAMRPAGRAEPRSRRHEEAGTNVDRLEVGDRGLEPTSVIDRHRQPAGNRTGKGDPAQARGDDLASRGRRQVDPPVAGIGADRGEGLHQRSGDGRAEPGARLPGDDDRRRHEPPCEGDGHDTILSATASVHRSHRMRHRTGPRAAGTERAVRPRTLYAPNALTVTNARSWAANPRRCHERPILGIDLANRMVEPGHAVSSARGLPRALASFPLPILRSDRTAMLEAIGPPLDDGLAGERRRGLGPARCRNRRHGSRDED